LFAESLGGGVLTSVNWGSERRVWYGTYVIAVKSVEVVRVLQVDVGVGDHSDLV
jgi:hypothetical protein